MFLNNGVKKRVYYFDLLKIISIMTIFIYHIMMDMFVIHPMHNFSFLEILLIRPNVHMIMVVCAIFIFISGATIKLNERNESMFSFYKRRLTKLLIPFYITYIIYFVIKAITLKNIHLFGGIEKWRFIWTIFGVDEYLNAAGIKTFSLGIGEWFLGCILICYILYPLLSYFDKKNKMATFIVLTIYDILINVFYTKFNFKMPQHFNVLCQIYNFYLGIFIISFIKDKKNLKVNKIFLNVICIFVILFLYFCKIVIKMPDNIKVSIMSVAICEIFSNFENVIEKNKIIINILDKFSVISFEFFLAHHFVIYEVDYLIGYRRVGGFATLFIIFAEILITILFAIIINKMSKSVNKCLIRK